MRLILTLSLTVLLTNCASVKRNSTALGDNKYLVTCDGNGYASTGDTMQCLAQEGNKICSAEGKQFRLLDAKNDSQLHVGTNFANGNPVPHMRPHGSATVECYGAAERTPASK